MMYDTMAMLWRALCFLVFCSIKLLLPDRSTDEHISMPTQLHTCSRRKKDQPCPDLRPPTPMPWHCTRHGTHFCNKAMLFMESRMRATFSIMGSRATLKVDILNRPGSKRLASRGRGKVCLERVPKFHEIRSSAGAPLDRHGCIVSGPCHGRPLLHIHAQSYIHTHIHIHIHIHNIHARIYTYNYTYTCTYACGYTQVHVDADIYIYI